MMNIELRKISLDDTINIVKWRNSPSVKKFLFSQEDITEEQHIYYFKNYIETGRVLQYIISVDNIDCGTTFLKNINLDEKEAEFGIFIGKSEFRGKGIATFVVKKMIEIGFKSLNLKRIYLSVLKSNIAAVKSYEHAGFKQTRILTNGYCRNKEYFDIVEMDIHVC